MIKTEDGYKLSTGKVIEPYGGVIGLSKDDYGFEIHEGYDDTYLTARHHVDEDDIKLSPEEQKEIATYMISMWKEFSESL